ncbi:flagellar biosynthesis protein FlgJ [Massilia sp. CCM 8695]|uniref:Flagellar biosynthesis protein FlgJ n=1 Tax=Massilia frigida TaxID=2609281 RepID=A0ABX0N2D8_9BURK|nr:rod-binding protein [Massilia frigida]NHZ79473.1 flagellar biosynthesis protein FlgJ [Massilia frigida]
MNPLDLTTKLNRAGMGPGQEAAVAPAADPVFVAKATKAAIEFESFFIGNMLQQMRNGTRAMAEDESVFKDPVNRDMQDMADKLMAGQMAHQRAFGVADAILRQLLPAVAAPAAGPLPMPLQTSRQKI